jgi:hypothetical protein
VRLLLLVVLGVMAVIAVTEPAEVHAQASARPAAPVRLVVPSTGVDAPVQALDLNSDGSVPVPQVAWAAAWYGFSAESGAPGNAVLAGHRDWDRHQGVFWGLGNVQPGDDVWLQDGADNWYLYRVIWNASYPEGREPIDALVGPTETPSVTLLTCSGTFSHDAGEYLERRAVRAELIATARADATSSSS